MQKGSNYSLEEIKNFSDSEWQEFRKNRWLQNQETYKDQANVPDWFWTNQKDDNIRTRAWIKKCNRYKDPAPADWFMADKQGYIDFLEKIGQRRKQKNNTNDN